jgi:hypothetical protein
VKNDFKERVLFVKPEADVKFLTFISTQTMGILNGTFASTFTISVNAMQITVMMNWYIRHDYGVG